MPELVPSPDPPVGDHIETISPEDMLDKKASPEIADIGISGTEFIASYNWLDDCYPKIIIPGKPPLWTPPLIRRQLQEDKGIFYRDRNAASYPKHPIEPAIVSVMQMHSTPRHVDVFACASTLRKLLGFLQGDDRPFRMLIEVIAGTVHLIRRENAPKEQILGVRGYGHTFPEAYTTWEADVKRSISHQRILGYRFCGLDMMVRYEGDGYIKSDKTPLKTSNKAGLLDLLDGLQVDRAGKTTSSDDSESILHVGNAGEEVKQEQVFDLKTRSAKRQDEDILAEELPRLWTAQIPNFILAFHDRGHFANVQIQNVRDKLKDWEAQNQSLLAGFFHLLGHIIDTAGDYGDSQLEIVRPAGGGLEIRKRAPEVGSVLSGPVRQSWAKWLSDGEDAGQDERAASLDVHTAKETSSEDDTACDKECGYCGKCAY
ncbi:hypothetical protein E5D57_006079 [Metarhizium anisopliae]|nr:hypothetical protein E5D57_006079 [Metarhizium anisopliae]